MDHQIPLVVLVAIVLVGIAMRSYFRARRRR